MRKMKAGIVTIHTDFNYGAVLQAVATQKFLELNGVNAEIIDYENKEIESSSSYSINRGKLYSDMVLHLFEMFFLDVFFIINMQLKIWIRIGKKQK